MAKKLNSKPTGDDIYAAIVKYCQYHTEHQTNHHQWEYKSDFLKIFSDAYRNDLCGHAAEFRFNVRQAKLKRKKLEWTDFVITGDSIKDRLKSSPKQLVTDLAMWWDEWTFAWDVFPVQCLTSGWKRKDWVMPPLRGILQKPGKPGRPTLFFRGQSSK